MQHAICESCFSSESVVVSVQYSVLPVYFLVIFLSYSLAGRYDNPFPIRFLAPINCSKMPALYFRCTAFFMGHNANLTICHCILHGQYFCVAGIDPVFLFMCCQCFYAGYVFCVASVSYASWCPVSPVLPVLPVYLVLPVCPVFPAFLCCQCVLSCLYVLCLLCVLCCQCPPCMFPVFILPPLCPVLPVCSPYAAWMSCVASVSCAGVGKSRPSTWRPR
jgi:hypothetical protein